MITSNTNMLLSMSAIHGYIYIMFIDLFTYGPRSDSKFSYSTPAPRPSRVFIFSFFLFYVRFVTPTGAALPQALSRYSGFVTPTGASSQGARLLGLTLFGSISTGAALSQGTSLVHPSGSFSLWHTLRVFCLTGTALIGSLSATGAALFRALA